MGKENEDYLDSLLNAVQGEIPHDAEDASEPESPDSTGQDSMGIGSMDSMGIDSDGFLGDPFEERKAKRKEKKRKPKRDASDAFLAEFEKELMETDAGDFLSDFELDMASGNFGDTSEFDKASEAEAKVEEKAPDTSIEAPEEVMEPESADILDDSPADLGLFESDTTADSASNEESVSPMENFDTAEDSLFNGLDAIMNSEDNAASQDMGVSENTADETSMNFGATEGTDLPEDLFGMPDMSQDMPSSDMPGVSDVMEEAGFGFGDLGFGDDTGTNDGAAAPDISGGDASADDIISMLNGLGEGDDDLKDIGSMLSAEENGESIIPEGDDISASELAGNLAGLGFDIDVQASDDSGAGIRDITDERNALIKEAEAKNEPPKGFLGKLKALFFGPDDDEDNPDVPVIANVKKKNIDEIAGELADEDADILRALEGGGEEAAEEAPPELDEKAKKAKEKEEKKKEKEAKKKEKAEKKAAAKAAKPPKVKKPKPPKVKTKPLPKGPVFVILLLAATILFGTLYIGKMANYRLAMHKATEYYAQGKYIEAYNLLNPLTIKSDDDKLLYRKVAMLAGMQEFYRSYEVLVSSGRDELALDSLIRMIGHYDVQINDAGEYGISAELTDYEGKAEKLLKDVYNITFEDALALYKQRDRQTYSMELIKVLLRAGIS